MAQTNMNGEGDVVIPMPSPSPSPIKNEMFESKSKFSQCTQRLKKCKKTTLFVIVFAIFSLVAALITIFFNVKHHQRESPAPSEDVGANGLSKDLNAAYALQQLKIDEEKQRDPEEIQRDQENEEYYRERDQRLDDLDAKRKEKMRVENLIHQRCRLGRKLRDGSKFKLAEFEFYCDLSDSEIWSIHGIEWPTHTQFLNLSNNEIKDFGEWLYVTWPEELRDLNLNNNKGLKFKNIKCPFDLEKLSLNGIGMNVEEFTHSLKHQIKLEKLYISNNKITFSDVSQIPNLRSLELIELDWKTMESIMKLSIYAVKRKLPKLRTVRIKDVGGEDLQQAKDYFEGKMNVIGM